MGLGTNVVENQMEAEDNDNEKNDLELQLNQGEIPKVQSLPLAYFRRKFVHNFDILYKSGDLM
jgi:hypothetical protein